MALTRGYTKTITNPGKFSEDVAGIPEISANYVKWSAMGSSVTIHLDTDFTTTQETALDTFMTSFVDFTTAESLKIYLDQTVFPFIDDVIHTFAAENMAMGITQYGKTGEVLGLFVKAFDVESNGLPISLRDTFDSGSLYESLLVIQHLRDNPTEYAGLSPFITDSRLLGMKNSIEVFLGVTPLST